MLTLDNLEFDQFDYAWVSAMPRLSDLSLQSFYASVVLDDKRTVIIKDIIAEDRAAAYSIVLLTIRSFVNLVNQIVLHADCE